MAEEKIYDFAIIGGGIIGAATFYKLQTAFPELKIILIEKENILADHQTGHNSGVIHSGLYYTPGSLKAKNCVAGRHELVAFAKEHNIPHDVCGKVVAAADESELPFMNQIFKNGIANQTEGLEMITAEKLREIEPHVKSIGGIWVPCTGIIDYRATTIKLAEIADAKNDKSKIVLGEEAKTFDTVGDSTTIVTSKNTYVAKRMIFCGGLQADRLAKKDNVPLKEKVIGFRGDYYELTDQAKHKVKNLIYPVPNPEFPFLGVHFTRMTNGDIECGPNAVFTFKREGYGKTDFSFKDTANALGYVGTWRFFGQNISFGIKEYRRAFSKRLFLKTLQRLIPDLTKEDLKPGRSGVRAMVMNSKGGTKDDFRIEFTKHSIHVINAPSPAATACLAIGGQITDMAKEHFDL
ncbi:MAG: L-2-hydroxyglutarate oxidase [Flavobacteriales bacterium]|nr:L-2-hydroxyglutarate oxidase [Flavobacteriales bacterium]